MVVAKVRDEAVRERGSEDQVDEAKRQRERGIEAAIVEVLYVYGEGAREV